LRRYVEALTGEIKKISVIHGEESQCLAFAETLRSMKPRAEVLVPESNQVALICPRRRALVCLDGNAGLTTPSLRFTATAQKLQSSCEKRGVCCEN
jgi:hypothetical protein